MQRFLRKRSARGWVESAAPSGDAEIKGGFAAIHLTSSKGLLDPPCASQQDVQSLNLGSVKEAFQLTDAGRMTHFTQRFGFDLPYPLAGDTKLPTNLFEGATISIN